MVDSDQRENREVVNSPQAIKSAYIELLQSTARSSSGGLK